MTSRHLRVSRDSPLTHRRFRTVLVVAIQYPTKRFFYSKKTSDLTRGRWYTRIIRVHRTLRDSHSSARFSAAIPLVLKQTVETLMHLKPVVERVGGAAVMVG